MLQQVGRFLARKTIGMRGPDCWSGGGHVFPGFGFKCIFRCGAQGSERKHQDNLRPERHIRTIGDWRNAGKAQFILMHDDRIVINFSGFRHKQ